MPPLTILYAAVCIAYGYCLEYRVNIAGPLILQFASWCPFASTQFFRMLNVFRSWIYWCDDSKWDVYATR